ncbi:MAG: conjugal transfer protein [Thalassobius sp.]|nr:conjugal transfer protein [Thalassovita sp.]
MKQIKSKLTASLILLVVAMQKVVAQGAAGIEAASSELKTYIDPVANMILIIGAVVGLIGGVRVYIKWNSGDQDVQKSIMGWFGSCLFLVVVGIVIKAFFGV